MIDQIFTGQNISEGFAFTIVSGIVIALLLISGSVVTDHRANLPMVILSGFGVILCITGAIFALLVLFALIGALI